MKWIAGFVSGILVVLLSVTTFCATDACVVSLPIADFTFSVVERKN